MKFAVFMKLLLAEIPFHSRPMRSLFLLLLLITGGVLSARPRLAHGEPPLQDSGYGGPSGQSEPQALTVSRVISGIVLDPSGAAITGAQVTLRGPDGNPIAHTTTGNAGVFRFDKVNLGNYDIEVEGKGFRKARIPVALGTKPPRSVRVVLAIASERQVVTVQAGDSSPQLGTEGYFQIQKQ